MYDILKNRIHTGGFKLADIQARAKKLYAMGDLSDEQLDELMALSQHHATAEAERPETLRMLRELADRVSNLEERLKDKDDTGADEELSEYDGWTAWDGISNKYQKGEIVSHGDKLWQSAFDGQNVWEPGTVGTENLWVEYNPETEA